MAAKGADVVQLERKGETYIISAAKYGEPFTMSQVADISLGDEVYVGLALCSHNADVTSGRSSATSGRRPANDKFGPYRDFIGSAPEILDFQTGHRQVL